MAIDPGHGGDDAGAHGAGGAVEKDLTLQVARRLKAAIESRIGLRVLLTREGDEALPIDRRTALANNNKADLLISLHANASLRHRRGARRCCPWVSTITKIGRAGLPVSLPVPVVGGRHAAHRRHAVGSGPDPARAAVGRPGRDYRPASDRTQRGVVPRSNDQAPLRVLVGANMPAVLVEMGFLSNADDERALTSGEVGGRDRRGPDRLDRRRPQRPADRCRRRPMIQPPAAPGAPRLRAVPSGSCSASAWPASSSASAGDDAAASLARRRRGNSNRARRRGTDGRKIHATVFYVADDGGELVPVSREVPLGAAPGEQARRIVEAQLQPAPSGLYLADPCGHDRSRASI